MTRGPPRSAPGRIQLVLSARSKSQGRQPNSSSPSPATCRESWGRGAATPRRYDPSSASPAFGAVLRRAAAVPSADFAARRRSIFLAVASGGATAPKPPLGRQSAPRPPSAARDSTRVLPANPFFVSRLLAVFKASYVSDGRLEGFGGRSFMRSTHRGAAIGGGTHRPRALRGRAKRQQRASRASLRGAALTARARQRSEAGRASASISSNHALFTLSPPGHGLAAGGSNA